MLGHAGMCDAAQGWALYDAAQGSALKAKRCVVQLCPQSYAALSTELSCKAFLGNKIARKSSFLIDQLKNLRLQEILVF